MYEATKHLTENYGLTGLTIYGKPDFSSVMEHVDGIVQDVYSNETPEIFERQGIDVYVNRTGAKFIDKNTVRIGDDILGLKYAVICTGSSPQKVHIPGSAEIEFLHNENFWSIRNLPESVLFVGGGVISAEIGQALARFGSKVTIFDRNPRILKAIDDDTAKTMIEIFKNEGVDIICPAELKRFRNEMGSVVVCYLQNGQEKEVSSERIFLATGQATKCRRALFGKSRNNNFRKGNKNQFKFTNIGTQYLRLWRCYLTAQIHACGIIPGKHCN
jgi:pyruvate/2-oxoglutarate dehydrogenase complex dihydrolipoamide dehydrogenase (E3) component